MGSHFSSLSTSPYVHGTTVIFPPVHVNLEDTPSDYNVNTEGQNQYSYSKWSNAECWWVRKGCQLPS